MRRRMALSLTLLLTGALALAAQDDGAGRSGPKEGAFLPAPFECYNLNGPHKGHYHCLVCRYGLDPAVLVFAREPEEGKDAALNALLKNLDDAVAEFVRFQLRAGVVFLSADARSSATNPEEADPAKLVEEAKKREDLYARLAARAEAFKGLDVAVYPAAGPKGYALSAKAEVTVVFYRKLRVIMTRSFGPGQLGDADVEAVMAKIRDTLEPPRKKR